MIEPEPEDIATHAAIWRAIEACARRAGKSTSGFAMALGLDSTTFNRSKRVVSDGRLRWPSSQTITLVAREVGLSWEQFGHLVESGKIPAHAAPGRARPDRDGSFYAPDRDAPHGAPGRS